MILGLPLYRALDILRARGEQSEIVFTAAPRRQRQMAQIPDGEMPPEYVARVIGRAPGRVICAWFFEPRP